MAGMGQVGISYMSTLGGQRELISVLTHIASRFHKINIFGANHIAGGLLLTGGG